MSTRDISHKILFLHEQSTLDCLIRILVNHRRPRKRFVTSKYV